MSIELLNVHTLLPVGHQQILVNALRAKKEGVVLFSIVINALRAIASVNINVQRKIDIDDINDLRAIDSVVTNVQRVIGIIEINSLRTKKKYRLF
jgi:hypothetical protein